jgi:DNA segregation ATPase FtsK/SpoIIIE, S-DNA-T family
MLLLWPITGPGTRADFPPNRLESRESTMPSTLHAGPARPPTRPGRLCRAARRLAGKLRLVALLSHLPLVQEELDLLTDVRHQRTSRPRWQRIVFVAVLAVLLAGILGPGEVLLAAFGLVAAAVLWPVLGWPGRVFSGLAAGGWALVLLGWHNAIPVAALVLFARWFCTPNSPISELDSDDAGLPALDPPAGTPDPGWADHSWPNLGDVPTQPLTLGTDYQPAAGHPQPSKPPADPAALESVLADWAQIAAAARLAGSTLNQVRQDEWGWTAVLELPPGLTYRDAHERRHALESALDIRPHAVRITQDLTSARRVQLRVFARDPLAVAPPWRGPQAGSILQPIPLGYYEDGSLMRLRLAGECVLIAGMRGAGKSNLLHITVGELAASLDVVLWGIDLKYGLEFGPWTPVFDRVAHNSTDAEHLLEAAGRVMDAHGELLAKTGRKDWQPTPQTPALVIVVDEQGRLRASKRAITILEHIATGGRALGVWLVSATQYPTVQVLGSGELRSQYTAKVVLRLERKQHVNYVLGEEAANAGWRADLIPADKPGTLYLDAAGATTPMRGRAFEVTMPTIDQVVERYTTRRPSLAPAAVAALEATSAPGTGEPQTGSLASEGTSDPPHSEGYFAGLDPEQAIIGALAQADPHGATIGDLKQATGMSRSWIYNKLRELAAAGRAHQVDRGHWALVPSAAGGDQDGQA